MDDPLVLGALVNFLPGACGARRDLGWFLSCMEHLVYRLEFDCYVLVIENLCPSRFSVSYFWCPNHPGLWGSFLRSSSLWVLMSACFLFYSLFVSTVQDSDSLTPYQCTIAAFLQGLG